MMGTKGPGGHGGLGDRGIWELEDDETGGPEDWGKR